MSAADPNIKTFIYKISAQITKLRLCTKNPLSLKIQWKRHQSIAQTALIQHKNQSSFQDSLVLEFKMYFDIKKNQFVDKKTDFNVVIERDGVIKSGGTIRIDIAETLNKQQLQSEHKIPLNKCPDTSAFLQFSLSYDLLSEEDVNDMSMMSTTSLSTNMQQYSSQSSISSSNFIQNAFDQESVKSTKSKKVGQLTSLVDRFQNLLQKFKKNGGVHKQSIDKSSSSSKIGREDLNDRIDQLQDQNRILQKQVDKKSTEILDKMKQINRLKDTIKDLQDKREPSTINDDFQYRFRDLQDKYQQQTRQLQLLKQNNNNDAIQDLQKQRYQLQDQLAKTTRSIGDLFNAAFEIGGAQLLDQLQTSIGLKQY